eukprot:scaffold707_cov240-Pinguiococcus_pyrenoidosus.AAC.5
MRRVSLRIPLVIICLPAKDPRLRQRAIILCRGVHRVDVVVQILAEGREHVRAHVSLVLQTPVEHLVGEKSIVFVVPLRPLPAEHRVPLPDGRSAPRVPLQVGLRLVYWLQIRHDQEILRSKAQQVDAENGRIPCLFGVPHRVEDLQPRSAVQAGHPHFAEARPREAEASDLGAELRGEVAGDVLGQGNLF